MAWVRTFLLAFMLCVGTAAAEPIDPPPPAPDIVSEHFRQFLNGLRRLLDQVPMFEAPQITPDGDILLKRIQPPAPEDDEARAAGEGLDL